ncbi:carbohydrate ABC transporter permease [Arthrobacter sp. ERGS1:01]|uniref:carbohydrate ABC transporter permease n=1 Tax=Arthrobacter sp. ERGS1:01 TaxID=1704044 RepID=UPI0006B61A71|nr:sugar ABC transporter permease [Arthrobacter sp. ERGS1:01]
MLKRAKTWGPGVLLLAPTIILVGVFVYWLIIENFRVSLTNQHTAKPSSKYVGFENYSNLLADPNFQHSLMNLLILTVVFLGGTLIFGFLWAWILEQPAKGEGFFRSVYLFPMSISFIASGVVWRWLLSSLQTSQPGGERTTGLNRLLDSVGLGALQNDWWSNPNWGIAAIAVPAIWQLSGYVMALFLAGFRGIPDELREAARIDGCSEWKLYRHVIFPQLSPVMLSAVIIIGHMSLKLFDLIRAIVPDANTYDVQVPATLMWVKYIGSDYADAAAIGSILLVLVALVVIPYLIHTSRAEKR